MFSTEYLVALQKKHEKEIEKLQQAFKQQLDDKDQIIQQLQLEKQESASKAHLLESQHSNELAVVHEQLEALSAKLKQKEQKEQLYITSLQASLEDERSQLIKRHEAALSAQKSFHTQEMIQHKSHQEMILRKAEEERENILKLQQTKLDELTDSYNSELSRLYAVLGAETEEKLRLQSELLRERSENERLKARCAKLQQEAALQKDAATHAERIASAALLETEKQRMSSPSTSPSPSTTTPTFTSHHHISPPSTIHFTHSSISSSPPLQTAPVSSLDISSSKHTPAQKLAVEKELADLRRELQEKESVCLLCCVDVFLLSLSIYPLFFPSFSPPSLPHSYIITLSIYLSISLSLYIYRYLSLCIHLLISSPDHQRTPCHSRSSQRFFFFSFASSSFASEIHSFIHTHPSSSFFLYFTFLFFFFHPSLS